MKKLTKRAYALIDDVVGEVIGNSEIEGAQLCEDGDNPFAFLVQMPMENDGRLVVKTCNELFHALGLLPEGRDLTLD